MTTQQVNSAANDAVNEAIIGQMTGKKWYVSKTFWANVVAGCAFVIQARYGYVFDPMIQALVMSGVNVALRKITKEPIVW